MTEINQNEKIIEVFYKERYDEGFNEYNPYYYVVDESFSVPDYRIIVVAPNITIKSSSSEDELFKCQFVKVNRIITRTKQINDTVFEPNEDWVTYSKKARRPFMVANVDLSAYFEKVNRLKQKAEIEKKLDGMAKKMEKVVKYKELAELNPDLFKEDYENYLKLLAEEAKNGQPLLNEGENSTSETE